jgi:predicted transcriptional regulator
MIVNLNPDLEKRLAQLASDAGVTSDELGQQVMDRYLDHVESLTADIREGEESAEREGWLTQDEVFENLHKRLLKTA